MGGAGLAPKSSIVTVIVRHGSIRSGAARAPARVCGLLLWPHRRRLSGRNDHTAVIVLTDDAATDITGWPGHRAAWRPRGGLHPARRGGAADRAGPPQWSYGCSREIPAPQEEPHRAGPGPDGGIHGAVERPGWRLH